MDLFKFEKKTEPVASQEVFRGRILRYFMLAAGVTIFWMLVGGIGFHYVAELSWGDALYNSAMMVSTMGPVFTFTTTPAKIFAAFYALSSGLAFIGAIGIAAAPIVHRILHIFHVEDDSSYND